MRQIKAPSAPQRRCHAPKPILLDTGELNTPGPWQPAIVSLRL
jgi:neutral ceramidase